MSRLDEIRNNLGIAEARALAGAPGGKAEVARRTKRLKQAQLKADARLPRIERHRRSYVPEQTVIYGEQVRPGFSRTPEAQRGNAAGSYEKFAVDRAAELDRRLAEIGRGIAGAAGMQTGVLARKESRQSRFSKWRKKLSDENIAANKQLIREGKELRTRAPR